MNSDQQNSDACDNSRGVRAGPRRRDELGPGESPTEKCCWIREVLLDEEL